MPDQPTSSATPDAASSTEQDAKENSEPVVIPTPLGPMKIPQGLMKTALGGYRGLIAIGLWWIGIQVHDFKAHVVVQDKKIEALESKASDHDQWILALRFHSGLVSGESTNWQSTVRARP